MRSEYKQNQWNHAPFNPLLCKAYVSNRERWAGGHQCKRKFTKDGWCSQHHPDKEVERLRKAEEKYKLKRENSIGAKLGRAKDRIEELTSACHATCLAIEFRGKVSMGEELFPDESNWRYGVEPYLLALYNWNRDVGKWSGGDMNEERWAKLMSYLEKGDEDGEKEQCRSSGNCQGH